MGEPVDNENLRRILDKLAEQREKDIESIRNLITSQVGQLRIDMQAQHTSIRGTLIEQNVTIAAHVKTFFDMFKAHEKEDDETKEEVIVQRETLKRFIWVGGLVIPGAYLLWEVIKAKLHIT